MHARLQLQSPDGTEQKFMQLGGALFVAPVADPDDVAFARLVRDRSEDSRVGGLMPGPSAAGPFLVQIELAKDFAESEDAVEMGEIVRVHRFGLGDGAMVRVVEEQLVVVRPRAMPADLRDE